MQESKGPSLRFKWTEAVRRSNLQSTTKQVLMALSRYMSVDGDSCYPGQELLATDTGLSKRTVIKHLKLGYQEGWFIKVKERVRFGQQWRQNGYVATFPQGSETLPKGSAPGAEDGELRYQNVVNKLHSNNRHIKYTNINRGFLNDGVFKNLKPQPGQPTPVSDALRRKGVLINQLDEKH